MAKTRSKKRRKIRTMRGGVSELVWVFAGLAGLVALPALYSYIHTPRSVTTPTDYASVTNADGNDPDEDRGDFEKTNFSSFGPMFTFAIPQSEDVFYDARGGKRKSLH